MDVQRRITQLWRLSLGTAAAAVAVLVGVTGCSAAAEPAPKVDSVSAEDSASTGDSASTSTADEVDPGAAFCDETAGLGDVLTALTAEDDAADYSKVPELVSTGAEILTTVDAPVPISKQWTALAGIITRFDAAFSGVDVQTEDDIEAALQAEFEGEEGLAMILSLPAQAEAVSLHLQQTCDVDLGATVPVISDVCAAVDPAQLGSVFGDAVPAGEPLSWGGATLECTWTAEEREVGAVVLPAATLAADYLTNAAPLEQLAMDPYTIDVYEGAFGPMRINTRGRTAATTVGDWGVLVSVQSGDDAADTLKAAALAGSLAVELE